MSNSLKSKCIIIISLYIVLSFILFFADSMCLLPASTADKTDAETSFYVVSLILSVVTVFASIYLLTNIKRQICRGFILYIVIQVQWLLVIAGYSAVVAARMIQSGDVSKRTMVPVMGVLIFCVIQVWFIKTIYAFFRQWSKEIFVERMTNAQGGTTNRIVVVELSAVTVAENVERPPSYQSIISSDEPPSYNEAVKKGHSERL